MNKNFLYSILFLLASSTLLSSCIEEDKYGSPLSVYEQGDNRRGDSNKIEDDEEKEEEEKPEGPNVDDNETPQDPEEDNEFLTLSGIYEGLLAETDSLDVTVEAKQDNSFMLALYDANVQGVPLGDLILDNIPATKKGDSYSFAMESIDVTLADGAIEATVDVEGEVSFAGDLQFVVAIQNPTLELSYKGTKKK